MRRASLAVLVVALLAACERRSIDEATGPTTLDIGVAEASIDSAKGATGPGSFYALYRPTPSNGRLVVFAHGYRDPALPVAPFITNDIASLRDALLARGWSFAYSTFSENGFAVKDGMQRTRQLLGLFASRYGPPDRTYITGRSLGGAITLALAEKNPQLFDGAMPQCGFLGGSQLEIDYIVNTRVLFDYFFPGVLPGTALDVPAGVQYQRDVAPRVVGALRADKARAIEYAAVDQIEFRHAGPAILPNGNLNPELEGGIVGALGFAVTGARDLVDRVHGRIPFDNTRTIYSGSADDEALNVGVARYASTPDARNYTEHWFEPSGRLRLPVLTINGPRDPVVPVWHQAVYADRVARTGHSDLLRQVVADGAGHCTSITTAIQIARLEELAAWAEGAAP